MCSTLKLAFESENNRNKLSNLQYIDTNFLQDSSER